MSQIDLRDRPDSLFFASLPKSVRHSFLNSLRQVFPTCPVTRSTRRLLEVFIWISFALVFVVGIGLGLRGARRRAHMAANLGLNVSGHFESMFAVRRPVRTRVFRHSIAASLRLVLPLVIGQAPPAPERLVEPDVREEPVAPDLGQRVLRWIELLLGLEHLEIAGEPVPVPVRGVCD